MTTIPFRPSNGMHGKIFMDAFCHRCLRDKAFRDSDGMEDSCPIVADAFTYDVDDPNYPKEWVIDADAHPGAIGGDDGARCTAFEPDPTP